jgi:hypothetical protein
MLGAAGFALACSPTGLAAEVAAVAPEDAEPDVAPVDGTVAAGAALSVVAPGCDVALCCGVS